MIPYVRLRSQSVLIFHAYFNKGPQTQLAPYVDLTCSLRSPYVKFAILVIIAQPAVCGSNVLLAFALTCSLRDSLRSLTFTECFFMLLHHTSTGRRKRIIKSSSWGYFESATYPPPRLRVGVCGPANDVGRWSLVDGRWSISDVVWVVDQ